MPATTPPPTTPEELFAGHPDALAVHVAAVLSIPLRRHLPSDRWKEVVQPAPGRWVHHLEVQGPGDLDEEVRGWLAAAAAGA